MELYFLRHAIAADEGPSGTGDAGRPLTSDGAAKMKTATRGLRKLGIKPDLLLSSPFVRARETAEIVARELHVKVTLADELACGCSLLRLQSIGTLHHATGQIMLVGHEPDFSEIIGELTGGSHVEMKKGGLARVDLDTLEAGTGTLVWLLPPRVLREIGW